MKLKEGPSVELQDRIKMALRKRWCEYLEWNGGLL
jgi:hypothetical protein